MAIQIGPRASPANRLRINDQTRKERRAARASREAECQARGTRIKGDLCDRVAFYAKVKWHVATFLILLYVLAFVDRVNISFAALSMNRDRNISESLFGLGAGIFFLGCLLFAIPSSPAGTSTAFERGDGTSSPLSCVPQSTSESLLPHSTGGSRLRAYCSQQWVCSPPCQSFWGSRLVLRDGL